jgi:PAN domain.
MSLLELLLLLLSATWTALARDCRQEDVHFEMMTGYVYSAPGEIMVTSPGVLLLRDCLEQCRRNDSCRSVNFETGLCVLFAGNYTDQPGRFYMGI